MSQISCIYPFYNNTDCLKKRLLEWSTFSLDILKNFQFVLIDDYSDEIIDDKFYDVNLNMIVARIENDIDWNQAGAHNLGSYLAHSPWLFMFDIDHWLDEKSMEEVLKLEKNENSSYFFTRRYNERLLPMAPNIYLISKNKFWDIGGYDEDFSGHYGYEDKLMNYFIRKRTNYKLVNDIVVNIDNFPTKGLNRNLAHNKDLLDKKLEEAKKNSYKNNNILRFKWSLKTVRHIEL